VVETRVRRMSVEAGIRPACPECGQALLLVKPDRIQCERCRMYGPPKTQAQVDAARPVTVAVPGIPCRGCGRTTVEGEETRLPLADGWCLGCRLERAHTR
jgi:hypothetical protein